MRREMRKNVGLLYDAVCEVPRLAVAGTRKQCRAGTWQRKDGADTRDLPVSRVDTSKSVRRRVRKSTAAFSAAPPARPCYSFTPVSPGARLARAWHRAFLATFFIGFVDYRVGRAILERTLETRLLPNGMARKQPRRGGKHQCAIPRAVHSGLSRLGPRPTASPACHGFHAGR